MMIINTNLILGKLPIIDGKPLHTQIGSSYRPADEVVTLLDKAYKSLADDEQFLKDADTYEVSLFQPDKDKPELVIGLRYKRIRGKDRLLDEGIVLDAGVLSHAFSCAEAQDDQEGAELKHGQKMFWTAKEGGEKKG